MPFSQALSCSSQPTHWTHSISTISAWFSFVNILRVLQNQSQLLLPPWSVSGPSQPDDTPLCVCVFSGLQLQNMEVPRRGVESELQLPAYATATATQDLNCICDLHHSSWQHWLLNPLSKVRDRNWNLMVPSWIRFHCATTGTPIPPSLNHLVSSGKKVLILLLSDNFSYSPYKLWASCSQSLHFSILYLPCVPDIFLWKNFLMYSINFSCTS